MDVLDHLKNEGVEARRGNKGLLFRVDQTIFVEVRTHEEDERGKA